MKRQKKNPGDIIAWTGHFKKDGDKVAVLVAVKGLEGYVAFPWDHEEPRGAFYSAAKQLAKRRGYDDVREKGVLHYGHGFIFEPVMNERKQDEDV